MRAAPDCPSAVPATNVARHSLPDTSSPRGFEIDIQIENRGRATLRLSGELDLCSADLLGAVVRHHLGSGRRTLRADLSRLRFLDCAGLSALLAAHQVLAENGGSLTLIRVGTRARRLMRIAGLDTVLHIAPTPIAVDPAGVAARTA